MIVAPKFPEEQFALIKKVAPSTKEQKKFIAQAISAAVEERLDPIIRPLAHGEGVRINMSLPGAAAVRVNELKKITGRPAGVVCRGLLEAYFARHGAPDPSKPRSQRYQNAMQSFGWDYRASQETCYLYVRKSLEAGKVGVVEAATGVGKTNAMLMAAHDMLQRTPGARVAIACPTPARIEHFLGAWKHMQSLDSSLPEVAAVFGRQEFVSRARLLEALNGGLYEDRAGRVRQWVDGGGQPEKHQKTACWLADSLKAVAPDFPVQDVLLNAMTSEEDPGTIAYREQFSASAPVVLCTHAMLAVDIRLRMIDAGRDKEASPLLESIREELSSVYGQLKKATGTAAKKALRQELRLLEDEITEQLARLGEDAGMLPNYQYLLVDEAHQLEAAFSNVLSDYVSIRKAALQYAKYREETGRASGIRLDDVRRANEIVEKLTYKTEKEDFSQVNIPLSDAATRNLIDELGRLFGKAKRTKKNAAPRLYWDIRENQRKLRVASKTHYLLLSCSPVRRYPRVIAGKPDVSQYLKVLWKSATGAACLSATLYLPVENGYSLAYQTECLALPVGRTLEFEPIVPEWLRSQVEAVWLPADVSLKHRYWLRPPARRDKLTPQAWGARERAWLGDVAASLVEIDESARGGVLVLLTAYTSVAKLEQLLHDANPELTDRLVVASRSETLEQQRVRFLKMTEAGIRPIWLAIGGAWTGMDLSADAYRKVIGKPVKEDWILTDLVIPRIPLGSNQSITHRYRMERRPGGQWDLQHGMFMLRQGIGRLIRSENLPGHRRIFLLDSRINDPAQKVLGARVRRILRRRELKMIWPHPTHLGCIHRRRVGF